MLADLSATLENPVPSKAFRGRSLPDAPENRMHADIVRPTAAMGSSRSPCLTITRYDYMVVAAQVLLLGSLLAVLAGVFTWLIRLDVLASLPPEKPPFDLNHLSEASVGFVAQQRGEVAVEMPETIHTSGHAADQSIQNEQQDVTVLAELSLAEASDMKAAELAELSMSQVQADEKSVGRTLPGRAEGTGNRPLGFPDGDHRIGGLAREVRWRIQYSEVTSLDDYARQLESLGIQLAAFRPGDSEWVSLADLTLAVPTVQKVSDQHDEQRLMMVWSDGSGALMEADRKLFLRAGSDVTGDRLVHFLSPQTEEVLAKLERVEAKGHAVESILRTEFGIRPASEGFEFFVIRQLFR